MSERDELERMRLEKQEQKERRQAAAAEQRRKKEVDAQRSFQLSKTALVEQESSQLPEQRKFLQQRQEEVGRVSKQLDAAHRARVAEKARLTREKEAAQHGAELAAATAREEAAATAADAKARAVWDRKLAAAEFKQKAIKDETDRLAALEREREEAMRRPQTKERHVPSQPVGRQPRSRPAPTAKIKGSILEKLQALGVEPATSTLNIHK